MAVVPITGAAGLIGSEAALLFAGQGSDIRRFPSHFPGWRLTTTIAEIHGDAAERELGSRNR